jgi:hypothetical protein
MQFQVNDSKNVTIRWGPLEPEAARLNAHTHPPT